MPFKEHPDLVWPPRDAVLWRYMNFTKFVSLLETKSLFFACPNELGDRFEGAVPKGNNQLIEPTMLAAFRASQLGSWLAVSCWHRNEHESAAMWKLYLKSNEGIAVRTSFERFVASLASAAEDVFGGIVRYIDYNTDFINLGNMFYLFTHKRKSFEHEQEFRAICFDHTNLGRGVYVKVDLHQLVEKVYVAPTTPEWFRGLIAAVLKTYSLDVPVIRSDLDTDPASLA